MVGEVPESDPELQKAHVHSIQSREERSLLDCFEGSSDWTRAAVAILKCRARIAREHNQKSREPTSLEEGKEADVSHSLMSRVYLG